MNTDRLPLTMVALTTDVSARRQKSEPDSHLHAPPSPRLRRAKEDVRSPELLGMVSLKFHDMDTRPDLDPWLGGLFVLPEWRNRGVGTLLMHRAVEEARKLNISRLYLWTPSAERLYAKLGWQVIERTNYFGKEAVVMQRNLTADYTD
jgi:GNAT superfamily N-acetyltransferase